MKTQKQSSRKFVRVLNSLTRTVVSVRFSGKLTLEVDRFIGEGQRRPRRAAEYVRGSKKKRLLDTMLLAVPKTSRPLTDKSLQPRKRPSATKLMEGAPSHA